MIRPISGRPVKVETRQLQLVRGDSEPDAFFFRQNDAKIHRECQFGAVGDVRNRRGTAWVSKGSLEALRPRIELRHVAK
jgi:hypothetical protein